MWTVYCYFCYLSYYVCMYLLFIYGGNKEISIYLSVSMKLTKTSFSFLVYLIRVMISTNGYASTNPSPALYSHKRMVLFETVRPIRFKVWLLECGRCNADTSSMLVKLHWYRLSIKQFTSSIGIWSILTFNQRLS